MNLEQYLKKSDTITSVNTLFSHFGQALKSLGYDRWAFIFFPPRRDAHQLEVMCPYYNFPKSLISIYIEEKIFEHGPVFEHIKTTGNITQWSDYFDPKTAIKLHPKVIKFFGTVKTFGYENGVSIPVFGPASAFAHIAATNDDQTILLDEYQKDYLKHASLDLLNRYMSITVKDKGHGTPLSPREKEVLSWVLQGKSNAVLADILGISKHTVDTHIRRSCNKLGASGRWAAAITAVLMGRLQY